MLGTRWVFQSKIDSFDSVKFSCIIFRLLFSVCHFLCSFLNLWVRCQISWYDLLTYHISHTFHSLSFCCIFWEILIFPYSLSVEYIISAFLISRSFLVQITVSSPHPPILFWEDKKNYIFSSVLPLFPPGFLFCLFLLFYFDISLELCPSCFCLKL